MQGGIWEVSVRRGVDLLDGLGLTDAASKGTLDRASTARSLKTALMWAQRKQPVDSEQGP